MEKEGITINLLRKLKSWEIELNFERSMLPFKVEQNIVLYAFGCTILRIFLGDVLRTLSAKTTSSHLPMERALVQKTGS